MEQRQFLRQFYVFNSVHYFQRRVNESSLKTLVKQKRTCGCIRTKSNELKLSIFSIKMKNPEKRVDTENRKALKSIHHNVVSVWLG